MIDTNKHIDYLNEVLNSKISASKFPSKKLFGVADFILKYDDDKPKKVPAVKKGDEYEGVVFDDVYNLMLFHKIRTSQVLPNIKERAYGNEEVSENGTRVTNVSLIAFLNSKIVNATQEQFANSIMAIFPSSIPKAQLITGVSSVKYSVMALDFETINIFRREYDGLEYDLKNDIVMVEVKYKIECAFNKSCINNCLI